MNSNDRAIVGLVMISHAMVHTYELSIPIFMTVWLDLFEISPGRLGLVVSAGYALFGLGALPGGVLADVLGSRRLIAVALFGMGGSFVALSLSPSIPVIAVSLLLWGSAASVYHPSGLSLISTGVDARGDAFAFHGMAGNAGIAFGPLATTLLLLFTDWHLVALVLAVPALLAGAYALRLRIDESAAVSDDADDKTGGVSSLAEFVAESKLLFFGPFVAVFGIVMASGLYYRGVLTFLPEMIAEFPMFEPIQIANRALEPSRYFYSGLLMVGIAGQYVGGKLTKRMPTERAIAIAFGVLALLALAFLPASNAGLIPFLVLGALLGFFLFVVQPLYQATVAEYSPAGTRGLSYGYTYLGTFGIGASGAAIAGGVLEFFSPGVLFFVLAGIALVAAILGAVLSFR
ncbi:MFS transporter [Halanaeroarchaeum sulfurireducens]|uniref:MFS transporter n=1 Tax=Halanaeroarchaeum sulfurireducens TaxID=1604004 RepID=UPI000678E7E7|nr:MFS transporter [Halanaeroarchaeum sulfurireducens]